jgi:hypothetical protein
MIDDHLKKFCKLSITVRYEAVAYKIDLMKKRANRRTPSDLTALSGGNRYYVAVAAD